MRAFDCKKDPGYDYTPLLASTIRSIFKKCPIQIVVASRVIEIQTDWPSIHTRSIQYREYPKMPQGSGLIFMIPYGAKSPYVVTVTSLTE